jgi:hypothetical protein
MSAPSSLISFDTRGCDDWLGGLNYRPVGAEAGHRGLVHRPAPILYDPGRGIDRDLLRRRKEPERPRQLSDFHEPKRVWGADRVEGLVASAGERVSAWSRSPRETREARRL